MFLKSENLTFRFALSVFSLPFILQSSAFATQPVTHSGNSPTVQRGHFPFMRQILLFPLTSPLFSELTQTNTSKPRIKQVDRIGLKQTSRRDAPRPIKRTDSRHHESKSTSSPSISFIEFTSEKNTFELLTSTNDSDHRIGKAALYQILKTQLHWKKKKGRREFLSRSIHHFSNRVKNMTEEKFFIFYDWFLSELQMNRHFFGNGAPRPLRKNRPWVRELSSQEAHLAALVANEDEDDSLDEWLAANQSFDPFGEDSDLDSEMSSVSSVDSRASLETSSSEISDLDAAWELIQWSREELLDEEDLDSENSLTPVQTPRQRPYGDEIEFNQHENSAFRKLDHRANKRN